MTSSSHGSKIPGSQQSYGRKELATLENTVIIFFSRKKNILHSHGSFVFFCDDSKSQEKLKTMVMQNLGGGEGEKRIIMVFSKVANGLLTVLFLRSEQSCIGEYSNNSASKNCHISANTRFVEIQKFCFRSNVT